MVHRIFIVVIFALIESAIVSDSAFATSNDVSTTAAIIQTASVKEEQITDYYWVMETAATNTEGVTLPAIVSDLTLLTNHTYRSSYCFAESKSSCLRGGGNWILTRDLLIYPGDEPYDPVHGAIRHTRTNQFILFDNQLVLCPLLSHQSVTNELQTGLFYRIRKDYKPTF